MSSFILLCIAFQFIVPKKWEGIMAEKEVLNSEEAAEFLGFSAFTIREYAKKGIIPAKKIGKEWRFYRPALVSWLTGKDPTTTEE
jgi:excisionase family DNA binding protein